MTRRRLTPSQKAQILERQAWTCGCGRGCDLRGQAVEYDHMIPLALGGADSLENLQALLVPCHRGAGGKTAADVKRIAKAKRQQKFHETGRSRARKGPPMQSRGFTGWRRFDGSPVKAETRSGANAAGE